MATSTAANVGRRGSARGTGAVTAGPVVRELRQMAMMPMMKEGPGSLVLGHVGQSGMMSGKTPNHTNHIVHFSSSHIGGVVFLLCDGSTHFIQDNIDYPLFKALGTRAGGEVVNL